MPTKIGPFQCSSASRKFLNRTGSAPRAHRPHSFSALQRAENSSIALRLDARQYERRFQCSSASRKFLNHRRSSHLRALLEFQCSSASRKFLNPKMTASAACTSEFQCSSASRKFLNTGGLTDRRTLDDVSVLFSEPKIPQFRSGTSSVCH